MNKDNVRVTVNKTFPILSLLGAILVVMKLLEVPSLIDVSWWLVLLPFYLGAAVMLGIFALAAAIAVIAFIFVVIADFFGK